MELPFVTSSMLNKPAFGFEKKLIFNQTAGKFADRYNKVPVFQVSGGRNNFNAFVYMCRLNLDLDGAPNTYGYDNPAKDSVQKNLDPLESWKKSVKGVSHSTSEKVGLGNACGDPGDGSKGWQNFLHGTRNFYWVGIKALTITNSKMLKIPIDNRAELEAGLETYARDGKPKLLPVGSGYFPVINPDTGYYISITSVDAADDSGSKSGPRHYLDSTVVPYAVWATHWNNLNIGGRKVQMGDFGLAIENATGVSMGFVYGDGGTSNKVGECSQRLHNALGKGAGSVTFIAFPGSGSGRHMGPHPELLIPVKVWANTLKLHKNAAELATRLAIGFESSKQTGIMTAKQTVLYKNFMSALSTWTFAR